MRICKLKDCQAPHDAKSFCKKHYLRWHRGQDLHRYSIKDPNTFRVKGDHAYIDLRDKNGSIRATVKLDKEDLEKVKNIRWSCSTGYAMSNKVGLLHRYILNVPRGVYVDHINHDRLDNTKRNLRLCTHQQNMMNVSVRKTSKHGYKGIYYETRSKKFIAEITYNSKRTYIGRFATAADAAIAYNKKALELHGQYAHLNLVS